MTRINMGVDPTELPDKLLLAEHREITRIPNAIRSGRAKIVDIPANFTLGKGHVKYFYTRMAYLHNRYVDLYNECFDRGFNVAEKHSSFDDLPQIAYTDVVSVNEAKMARQLIIERIKSKGFKLKPSRYVIENTFGANTSCAQIIPRMTFTPITFTVRTQLTIDENSNVFEKELAKNTSEKTIQ